MKNSLDMIEKAQDAAKKAIELANASLGQINKMDVRTAQDVSNLLTAFASGNNALSEDVANQILKNSEERLKQQKDADNTK